MKVVITIAAPPDLAGKPQPISASLLATDDTGGEVASLSVKDVQHAAAILPRIFSALACVMPAKK